ncbi:MAG: glycosyltransferase family 39 protein [Planctomycetota bacterium]
MNERSKAISLIRGFVIGMGGLLLWLGLDLEVVSTEGARQAACLRLFGCSLLEADRAFFLECSTAMLPAGLVCILIALVIASVLFFLLGGLFPLKCLKPGSRLSLFACLAVLVLLDLNPLIAAFMHRIPANFEIFAIETLGALEGLAAFIAGLSLAHILHSLLGGKISSIEEGAGRLFRGPALPLIVAAAACTFAVWVRSGPMEGMATVSDELSYLKQADLFAQGRLAEDSLEPRAFFDAEQMLNDGRYYSKYPPGASLCYAPFAWLGRAGAIPAFFLIVNLLLTWLLARRLFGGETAAMALLLAGLSPFFVSMGESFLSHGPGLCAALCMTYFHACWLERERGRFALLSGIAAGFLFLIRPVTSLALILPLFIHGQIAFKGHVSRRILCLVLFAGVLAAFAGLLLLYNHSQTGDALVNPYQKYADLYAPYDRFSPDNAGQGGLNTAFNLSRLNRWLFGFAPSLLPVALLFLLGAAISWDILFVACLFCLAAGYVFHWFWGTPWYGPLYYYECAAFLVILAARGLCRAGAWLRDVSPASPGAPFLAGLCILILAAPSFLARQSANAESRVHKIWNPVLEVREYGPEPGAWVIFEQDASGFNPYYVGATPGWMIRGFRILDGKGGDPQDLKALHAERRIFLYKGKILEEVSGE